MAKDPITPTGTDNRRLALVLAVVLVGLLFKFWLQTTGITGQTQPGAARPASATRQVTLVVRQPDADTTKTTVPWVEGLTVAQATQGAGLEAVWRGSGQMAFLESLSGVANQGASGLNWQFEVNDDYADEGAGAVTLDPGDRVLWKLAPYE